MVKRDRSIGNPSDLAGRVRRERERKGWSLDKLAEKMAHNPKLSKAAIFRIESGERPVRVTELLAFARAFKVDDPLDLMRPLELLDDEEARALIEPFDQALDDIIRGADRLWVAERAIFTAPGNAGALARTHSLNRLRELEAGIGAYAVDKGDVRFDLAVAQAVRVAVAGGIKDAVWNAGWVGEPVEPERRREDQDGQR